jgi:type I restriction enzyme S subunit
MKFDGKIVRLGDVVTLQSGNTPSKSEPNFWEGEFPWASAKDMKKFFISNTTNKLTKLGVAKASRVVEVGATLILTRGMTLVKNVPICVVNQPTSFNQDLKAVIPKDGLIETDFIPYLLLGNKSRIHALVDLAGHGTGRLATKPFLNLDVYIPEAQDRRRIVSLFQGLDKKIEINRQINQTLEQISQATFKSWFVDFEPVKAKVIARNVLLASKPTATKQTILEVERLAAIEAISGVGEDDSIKELQKLADLFPSQLDESDRGEIPFGWKRGSFSAVFEERKEKVKERIDVKVVSAVQTGELKVPEDVFNKQIHSKDTSKYKLVYPTDLAYNPSRINIGSGGFNLFGYMGAVSPVYSVMKLKEGNLLAFARMQMKRKLIKEWINNLCSGSVRQSLSVNDLLSIPITIPSDDLLNEFNQVFEAIERNTSALKDENRTLEFIRNTLLKKLLLGEVDLTNNQKEVVNG